MGYWKRTTLIRKRYETTVGHDSWVNLRQQTANIEWKDERVLLNQHNFYVGSNYIDVNARQYYGLSFAIANPRDNNVYNTQIGIVKANGGVYNGLIHQSGNQYNSNTTNVIYSGTYYAFFFMVAFNNKYNGLTNNSGFGVYANGNLIAHHYVKEPFNYLNNFCVAQYISGGWTGNIEIRPTGNRNFKVGYENFVIHNLFIYTQPVTFYPNNATLIAIEGDM